MIIHNKGGIKVVGSNCENKPVPRWGGKIKHQKKQVVAKLRMWCFLFNEGLRGNNPSKTDDMSPEVDVHRGGCMPIKAYIR